MSILLAMIVPGLRLGAERDLKKLVWYLGSEGKSRNLRGVSIIVKEVRRKGL